jgi:hypothetical protein
MNGPTSGHRWAAGLAVGVAALVVIVPFFAATTLIGDDHLFLAFARHAPHPFAAFLTDRHGGEYYRPLPMMIWWLLGRLGGGGAVPFALLGLALHAATALLVAALLRALGRPPVVTWTAAALMAWAPENLEAALWFAANTDLLATTFVLASLVLLLRGRRWWSALSALAAFLSKESAYVLPVLAVVVAWSRPSAEGAEAPRARPRWLVEVAPQLALLTLVVLVRRSVLHGWGGSGDPRPSAFGAALQIAGGLAQVFTGTQVIPVPLAFGVGAAVLALSSLSLARRGRGAARFAPLAFILVAVAPLAAAGWVVGARYFYLPAVGLCWAAAEALADVGAAARITLAALLVLVGAAQAVQRRGDVLSYEKRLAATRRAVAEGLRAGHHVFHVDGGLKDVDLAVKEIPALEAGQVLVLGDVPASFAIIPPTLSAATAWVAAPPLPPGGSYDLGDVRVVALARRGDEPDLEEVLAKFPDLRLIRLRTIRGGRVIARDLTDETKVRLDAAGSAGQD